jgi:1-acyl-sn-glycerol-3-phosphate acyltransferase
MEDRKRQIDAIVDALGVDRSLILFPEGTRGPGPTLQPFRSGLYHLCRRKPGLEIVPVHLDNVHRVLPREELVPVPLACGITFGPPMTLADGEAKDAFLERARAAVRRLEPEEAPC